MPSQPPDPTSQPTTAAVDRPPRILVVHERYRERAGEDAVFDAEVALLRGHGLDVRTLVVDNADIDDRGRARLRLGLETVWSMRAARRITRVLAARDVDVVHVHNTFPVLSPSIHVAAARAGVAVVQTVHNYRPICPAATLYRDGHPCEDCVGRAVAWPALVHACSGGSRLRTAPIVAMLAVQRLRQTWRSVHAIVALTAFARDRLIAGGLPADRIHVKPNVVPDPGPPPADAARGAFLFAGRLSPEKGVDTLVAAAGLLPESLDLRVAGDGPDAARLRGLPGAERITWLGRLDPARLGAELRDARALVFPSRWYEGMPMIILEAFAAGVPVIGARIGSVAELVDPEVNGLLVPPDDPAALAGAIRRAHEDPELMAALGRGARRTYEASHTPDAGYAALMAIYAAARRQAAADRVEMRRPRSAAPTASA